MPGIWLQLVVDILESLASLIRWTFDSVMDTDIDQQQRHSQGIEVHKEAPLSDSRHMHGGNRTKVTIEVEERGGSELEGENTVPTATFSGGSNSDKPQPLSDLEPEQMQKQSGPEGEEEHGTNNVAESKREELQKENEPEDKQSEFEEAEAISQVTPIGILKKSNYVVAEKGEAMIPPSEERKGKCTEKDVGGKKVHIWHLVSQ